MLLWSISVAGCTSPVWTHHGPVKVQRTLLGFSAPARLMPAAMWIHNDGEAEILCVEWVGGMFPGVAWAVAEVADTMEVPHRLHGYQLATGKRIFDVPWQEVTTPRSPDEERNVSIVSSNLPPSAPLHSPFLWLSGFDADRILAVASGLGYRVIRRFPQDDKSGRSHSRLVAYLGREQAVITSKMLARGEREIRLLFVDVHGYIREMPLPDDILYVIGSKDRYLASAQDRMLLIDEEGRAIWKSDGIGVRQIPSTGIGVGDKEYFVINEHDGYVIRRFRDGAVVDRVQGAPARHAHSVGDTVAVIQSDEASPYEMLTVYVGGKRMATISTQTTHNDRADAMVMRPGNEAVIGWSGTIYDLASGRLTNVKGYPTLLWGAHVITTTDHSIRAYLLVTPGSTGAR